MNANTRLRLWKETRALLPMWAAAAGLIAVPFLLRQEQPMRIAIPAFWLGCAVLGPVAMGQEFQHRTMANLLAQPITRRRVWWEKMATLAVAMLSLFLWMELLWGTEVGAIPVFRGSPELVLNVVTLLLFPMLVGFCSGPMFALLARSTLGGVVLTFLCPWLLFMVGILLVPRYWLSHGSEQLELNGWIVAIGFYSAAALLYGCRRFARLEDVNLLAQEFAAPRQFDSLFAWLTAVLAPGRDSQLANLARKEVRLQRPAFVVAGMVVVLWLILVAVLLARPSVDKGFTVLPTVLLCLGIPIIAGIVSTAEERSLGLLDWHLTMPVSVRRQWFVKVYVAFGVNIVLGILLAEMLGHGSVWIFGNKSLLDGIPTRIWPLLIANLVIFCAALYASTFSANTMRALVGAIAVLVTAFSVILWWPGPQIFRVAENNWVTAGHLLTGSKIEGASTSLLWGLGAVVTCLISLQVVAAKLFIQQVLTHPLTNFRWRPDSSLMPIRQMVALISVLVGLLLLSLGVMECVEYFWSSAFGQRTSP